MLKVPTITLEYVHVPFSGTGALTDVEMALVSPDGPPSADDWHTATYEDGVARLLVGPDGGALVLTEGTVYALWVRGDAGVEQPARPSGYVVGSNEVP